MEEKYPNGSAKGSPDSTERPPSTTASLDSGKDDEKSNKSGVRKSARGRVPKRKPPSPSPSPPPQRPRSRSKQPPKKTARKEPPKTTGHPEPPKHVLSRPKPRQAYRSKSKLGMKKVKQPRSESSSDEESDSDSSMCLDPVLNAKAGVYAPLLRARQKRYSDCVPVVPLPPRVIGGVCDQRSRTSMCQCKKSNCLKLYCDCFMAGLYCSPSCNCKECKNSTGFPRDRNIAIDAVVMRNPNAFRPRLSSALTASSAQPEKGCKCKKSSCLKKVNNHEYGCSTCCQD